MEKPKAGRPRKYLDVVRILIYAPDAARAEIRAAAEKIKARYLIDAKHPPDRIYFGGAATPPPATQATNPQPPTPKDDGDN